MRRFVEKKMKYIVAKSKRGKNIYIYICFSIVTHEKKEKNMYFFPSFNQFKIGIGSFGSVGDAMWNGNKRAPEPKEAGTRLLL